MCPNIFLIWVNASCEAQCNDFQIIAALDKAIGYTEVLRLLWFLGSCIAAPTLDIYKSNKLCLHTRLNYSE